MSRPASFFDDTLEKNNIDEKACAGTADRAAIPYFYRQIVEIVEFVEGATKEKRRLLAASEVHHVIALFVLADIFNKAPHGDDLVDIFLVGKALIFFERMDEIPCVDGDGCILYTGGVVIVLIGQITI
jgi:hypothetical protein